MILSGFAFQQNGFGSMLWSATYRLMAACRSTTPRKAPRLRRRLVNAAKKPSTAFIHEALVGVFAALDVLEGKVIGRCMQRHRHQEFIRFLNAIEKTVPTKKAVHVILDNYAAHKHPKVIAWLSRHPRVTFHFTGCC
jgi:hypothetical protein